MKEKTAKQILTSYRIKFAVLVLLYVAALAALIGVMTVNMIIGIVGIVILALSVKAAFDKLREHEIERIIYEDLDPEKFGEILALGLRAERDRYRLLYALESGDHKTVIDLVGELQKKETNPIGMCNNLYRLGYVYFEEENFEGLEKAVDDFERLKKKNPKLEYAFSRFSVFDKFDAMLAEDYEYVVDVCELDLAKPNDKEPNHKLTKINVSYYRAVALERLGRNDEAREAFREIIDYAPKMYKARLSQEHLDRLGK